MKATIVCCLLAAANADLRQAAQPKNGGYRLLQQGGGRGAKNFAVGTGQNADGTTNNAAKGKVLYMEPSVFGYQGLKKQRQKNYDNFLRSNIDNEQDNRNFNNEAGLDHLPFRTFESAVETKYPYIGAKAGADDDSLQVNNVNVATVLRVKPGEPKPSPLRWNNPHAAELEVNLWIMCSNPPTIVPIKKPTCSGEGNQNNIVEWSIPEDFNNVNWQACASTKCFTGCNTDKDCVLQIYAHSVETRQYSNAVPIIIDKQNKWTGRKLQYNAVPKDAKEVKSFAWPTSYDLKSMVTGDAAQNPGVSTGQKTGGTLNDVKICASSQREGIAANGEAVPQVTLGSTGTTAQVLNAPGIHLYLCKQNELEVAGEQLVNKVLFQVSNSDGSGPLTRTENYSPYEFSSANGNFFGGAALKKVKATLTSFAGATRVVEVLLDLRENSKRWRFRRHLQAVCSAGVPAPFPDPWMDLSKLKRETCLSAQDPNSNFAKTQVQRAVLHSDVANHAYQNSNYSPYSGQQHGEISRNLQAAAVVHMTSGNRGELGKNNLPKAVKDTLKQLNKQVNKIYKAYEKVANKVIDELSKTTGGKNGAGVAMGVQQLGTSFRSAEKGATSTKRLKTTTYVPSFSTASYDANTINKAIASRTGGNKAKYADLLSTPKANTGGTRFIEIYTATMNQMLPAFAQAENLGITYMESVKMRPCSTLASTLQSKSTGANRQATACCTGSMQNTNPGGCGASLQDVTQFKKRNADNKKDGGQYAAKTFIAQRYSALYDCPQTCLQQNGNSEILTTAVSKTSTGTCITWDAGSAGCVQNKVAGATDCRPCAGVFNNVAPTTFSNAFKIGNPGGPSSNLDKLISRVRSAGNAEPLGNVLNGGGEALAIDDTAVCHTPSTFACPGGDKAFEADVKAGKCKEEESTKIDKMCDDGPCDNDPNSEACRIAKGKCEVDPATGVKCMKGNENDPCADCIRTISGGQVAAVAFTSLFAFASLL